MPRLLKVIILALYQFFGLFQKRNSEVVSSHTAVTRKFHKKYSWFFEWHRFFWICCRSFLSEESRMPLHGNDDDEFLKRRNDYYELAMRDFTALSMTEKIMRPTRYTLAPDTALALCLMYGSTMRIAPGLYGSEARITAMRKQRSICLILLGIFLFACFFGTTGSILSGWLIMLSLIGFMLGGVGWYADLCLLHMACEAERLHKAQKTL